MLRPQGSLRQVFDDASGLEGGGRERTGDLTSSGPTAFDTARRRHLEPGALGEREIIESVESSAFPERHIAGAPGIGMAPGITTGPEHQISGPGTATRAGRFAGEGAAGVVRLARKARSMRQMNAREMRYEAERYVATHPYSLLVAAVAGFLLGRLMRR
ncbi:MAG: hypothetical protein ACM3ZB_05385 [bacterium]|jgi:hypothetical protein